MEPITSQTFLLLLPEIMLFVLAVCIYVGGAFSNARSGWAWLAIMTLALAGFALSQQNVRVSNELITSGAQLSTGGIFVDSFGHCFRWVGILLGILFVLAYLPMQESDLFTEGLGSIVFIVIGV
ncbi:MAG: hypothetical protein KDB14_33320, partial [Planctomycetales bacterium]|nr:hypothetical protein [Planctomycetales bacterium]